jgi:endogenous inhibitor of DNA gyrase (YacG/DUF329 family)
MSIVAETTNLFTYTCKSCGSSYSGKRAGTKFCSKSCRLTSYGRYQHRKIMANCEKCGTLFHKTRPFKLFCSQRCRGRAANTAQTKRNIKYRGASIENYLIPLARKTLGRKHARDIGAQDLIALYYDQKGLCALTGVPMTYLTGRGRVITNASVDRIDGSIGYLRGNVRLVCCIANSMKNVLTDDELRHWCKLILENTPRAPLSLAA